MMKNMHSPLLFLLCTFSVFLMIVEPLIACPGFEITTQKMQVETKDGEGFLRLSNNGNFQLREDCELEFTGTWETDPVENVTINYSFNQQWGKTKFSENGENMELCDINRQSGNFWFPLDCLISFMGDVEICRSRTQLIRNSVICKITPESFDSNKRRIKGTTTFIADIESDTGTVSLIYSLTIRGNHERDNISGGSYGAYRSSGSSVAVFFSRHFFLFSLLIFASRKVFY